MTITDNDYLFLANCSNIEFHNLCIIWLEENEK